MKICIKDFGPISKFDFDLSKDLNVILGENNIGKSYAITVIYLIIKNLIGDTLGRDPFNVNYFFYLRHFPMQFQGDDRLPQLFQRASEIEKNTMQKLKESDEVDITAEVSLILNELITESLIHNLEQGFKSSFSSIKDLKNKYSNNNFLICLSFNDFSFTIAGKGNSLEIKTIELNRKVIVKRSQSNRTPHLTDDKTILYLNKKSEKDKGHIIFEYIISKLFFELRSEVSKEVQSVYFLPASRSGLYQALSTFSAVIAELSKSRNFLTKKIELPNISVPVSDYFLFLSNINSKNLNTKYKRIVKDIEEQILKGEILFNPESKKIVFSSKKINTELDLSFTSSMISEIAPIVAFLKYIIVNEEQNNPRSNTDKSKKLKRTPAQLVFIEEPEAHLHPKIQVKMMELFSKLVYEDVKIIITTHSNYMFNKLSNLILSKTIDNKRVGSYFMKSTALGSIIDLKSLTPANEGIEDQNFSDVAEELYEERINLYDKLNQNAD